MLKGKAFFQIWMLCMYVAGLAVFAFFLLRGASYYLTPFSERPHHPDYGLLRPAGEQGLAFGIVGSLMLVTLLAYSLRRRTRLFGQKIPLKFWLDVHIFLGVMGPLFIVLHTSFRWGGLVSLSFWSMVGVALSGIFGRYLYVQIPRDIYGKELEIGDLSRFELELRQHLSGFPELPTNSHQAILSLVEGRSANRVDLLHMLLSDLSRPWLYFRANRLLSKQQALTQAKIVKIIHGLKAIESKKRTALRYSAVHKLLHHWHVIHRPFALIMYLIMGIHIGVALLFAISWR